MPIAERATQLKSVSRKKKSTQRHNTMNMQKKRTIAALGAALVIATGVTVAVAQRPNHTPDPQRQAARQELMEKMRTFAKTEVLPEVTRWKSQLDNAMSPTDLQKLNTLRARSTTLRQQRMETGLAIAKAWKAEDYGALKQSRDKMKTLEQEQKAIFADLKPLAETYKSTLLTIGAQAKPKMAAWREQGKAIFTEWAQSHKSDSAGAHPRMGGHGMGMGMPPMFGGGEGGKDGGAKDPGAREKMMAARFMLWDGGDFTQHADQMLNHPGMPDNGFNLK